MHYDWRNGACEVMFSNWNHLSWPKPFGQWRDVMLQVSFDAWNSRNMESSGPRATDSRRPVMERLRHPPVDLLSGRGFALRQQCHSGCSGCVWSPFLLLECFWQKSWWMSSSSETRCRPISRCIFRFSSHDSSFTNAGLRQKHTHLRSSQTLQQVNIQSLSWWTYSSNDSYL